MASLAQPVSAISGLPRPLRGLADAIDRLRAAQRAALTAQRLFSMDDAALSRNGLSRADIPARIIAELDAR